MAVVSPLSSEPNQPLLPAEPPLRAEPRGAHPPTSPSPLALLWWCFPILLVMALTLAAVAQPFLLRALSPTDLAYYHQSLWSATHGLGFAQTVLQFDGSSLLGSLHLDLIRVALVPAYALWPSVYLLVSLQAVGIGLAAWLTARLFALPPAEPAPAEPAHAEPWLLPCVMTLACLHPLSIELALADFRPLVLMVPGTLLTLWALERQRLSWMVVGGLITMTAREEGWQVLGALLPYAGIRAWRTPSEFRPLAIRSCWMLLSLTLLGLSLPLLAWGKLSQLSATASWRDVLAQLQAGERPLFRSPDEAQLAGWSLWVFFPALCVPELLLPALAAVGVLTVLSPFEGVGPAGRGVHYWSVVQPLLLSAWALGLVRVRAWMGTRARVGIPLMLLCTGLLMLSGARQQLHRLEQLLTHLSQPSEALRDLHEQLAPLHASGEALLVSPALSGLMANRAHLRVVGEARLDPHYLQETVQQVDAAVLEREGSDELRTWQLRLEQAGFEPVMEVAGYVFWRKRGTSP
ncbi:MAG: DUF2079 domain-containing protein [Myxococcota bacterium]